MVKVLSFRFQHCFDRYTILLVKGTSETGLFRHLSNHFFWTGSVEKPKIQKKLFVPEIIASKDVAINSLY